MNNKKILFLTGVVTAGLITAVTHSFRSITEQPESTLPVISATRSVPGNTAASPIQGQVAQNAGPHRNTSAVSDSAPDDLLSQPDPNAAYATFGDRIAELSNRRQGQSPDISAIHAALEETNAWTAMAEPSPDLSLTHQQRYDGREFISVNPAKIESLVPGDTLDIHIPQINGNFTATIHKAVAGIGGSVNWEGRLENMPDSAGASQVYFTSSGPLIVGGITTPHGHFELEAHGNAGWIVSSKTLFKEPDTLIEVSEEELSQTPAVSEKALAQNQFAIEPLPMNK
ncbi:MAG: hypothetical protein R3208_14640 [Ketobacteraceae bacterium]|nr:hypothetical protein [Ketobacteraceae bacterium]